MALPRGKKHMYMYNNLNNDISYQAINRFSLQILICSGFVKHYLTWKKQHIIWGKVSW